MQRNSNQLRLHALVSAVTIFCGSCGWYREPAPGPGSGTEPAPVAGSGDEPAQVVLLTDDTARSFLEGTWPASGERAPPPPPDGRVVVAGGDNGMVLAFVLGENLDGARKQLDDLSISRDVQGCSPGEGDTCCDLETKTYVLDVEFEGERFWFPLGERCAPSDREGSTEEDPPEEGGADFVEVKPEIIRALEKDYGVNHPYMTLAKENGEGRVLVDPSAKSGELWLPPATPPTRLDEGSLIILADHKSPPLPGPPPGYKASNVAYCKLDLGDRCNAERHPRTVQHSQRRHHWYRWNDSDDLWYEMPDTCKCVVR